MTLSHFPKVACLQVLTAILLTIAFQANAPTEAQTGQSSESRLTRIEDRLSSLERAAYRYSSAELSPSELGKFARLNSATGSFTITLRDVEPYLDGHKIHFDIGNLTSVTFKGFKVDFHFGSPSRIRVNGFRTVQQSYPGTILPGSYIQCEAVLPATKVEDIKSVYASIVTSTIAFYEPR